MILQLSWTSFSEHHLSHAAAAFYPSPFEESVILCMDGVGEWATTSAWIGTGRDIQPLWEISFSLLGLFTQHSPITAGLRSIPVNTNLWDLLLMESLYTSIVLRII